MRKLERRVRMHSTGRTWWTAPAGADVGICQKLFFDAEIRDGHRLYQGPFTALLGPYKGVIAPRSGRIRSGRLSGKLFRFRFQSARDSARAPGAGAVCGCYFTEAPLSWRRPRHHAFFADCTSRSRFYMATGIYSGQKIPRRAHFVVEVSAWTFRRERFGGNVSAWTFRRGRFGVDVSA